MTRSLRYFFNHHCDALNAHRTGQGDPSLWGSEAVTLQEEGKLLRMRGPGGPGSMGGTSAGLQRGEGCGVRETASCGLNRVFPKFMSFQEPQNVTLLRNRIAADVSS